MKSERVLQLKRSLATLRDPSAGPAQRALAGAAVSAACASAAEPQPLQQAVSAPSDDSGTRMFGYGMRHDAAMPWDGKATRSGTITYVDDERVEQYVGQQQWIAYRQSELNWPGFVIGDRLRIGRRAGAIFIEAVADNRLGGNAPSGGRPVRSGLTVMRSRAFDAGELAATAHTVAERYAARLDGEAWHWELTFGGGGKLALLVCERAISPSLGDLVGEPLTAALRLEVTVNDAVAAAALEAECALVYAAALAVTAGEGLAVDDTGAIFSAEALYDLGVRESTRAAAFSFAAAAARRAWPSAPIWFSARGGVCDELTVLYARAWRADFAAAYVNRTLAALSDAMLRTGDPVIPVHGTVYPADSYADPGQIQALATLEYERVGVDVAFIDFTAAGCPLRDDVAARTDLPAILGADICCAVVICFGNRLDDVDSDAFALEMRRADALATAVAAALARRGDCIAVDAAGAVYSADELIELAVQRRGKDASWTARVTAATGFASDSND
jgi:hypothetical protein